MRNLALITLLTVTVSSTCLASAAPTPAEAAAFVVKAEEALAKSNEYLSHAAWVQATYINSDTDWLLTQAQAQYTILAIGYATKAARFDHVRVDELTRRKLHLLKQELVLPAASRAGAADELARISARLRTQYSTAKFNYQGKTLTLDDMEDLLRSSRDPTQTRVLWEGWRAVSSPSMKGDYSRLVDLVNEGSHGLGYSDTGMFWRSWYDMPPDAFATKVEALWNQVKPLYDSLHCYVRSKLNQKYGATVQPAAGPIRADLLGNMWSQSWGNIYDIVRPQEGVLGYDLTASLLAHGYDAEKIVHTADNWYQSIGFAPEPPVSGNDP